MDKSDGTISDNIEVVPVVVVSQTFPARPSSIPDIRDFVRRCLAQSPLSEQDNRAVGETVSQALLEAAGPTGAISVSFRIFPDHVEVDVLKSGAQIGAAPGLDALSSLIRADEQAAGAATPAPAAVEAAASGAAAAVGEDPSFAEWMSGVLRREGLTMEAAARQLGVSVKTVSRWVGGTTEPRLRDLRRIRELFGEIPFSLAVLDVPPVRAYRGAMADTIEGTFQSGPGSGRLLIKTGRAGMAARAGHDLTLEVTKWSARVTVPDENDGGITAATVSAELDLGSLAVREGSGGAKPLSDRDRRDILASARKILGDRAIATFTSSRIIPSSGGGAIEGTLALGGKSEPVRLQVVSPAPGKYRGSATVRQTALGITPYSGFFGALKLRDEVTAEFEVDLTQNSDNPARPT